MSAIEPEVFEPEGEEHHDREHYKIGGKAEADWALRKLKQARDAIAEVEELARAEAERIEQWAEKAKAEPLRDAGYFESILRNWHEEQLEADPKDTEAWKKEKHKTIKLPAGDLAAAKNPPSIVIDKEKFVPWAVVSKPEWVLVETVVTQTPIAAAVKAAGGIDPETGEVAPGVEIKPGELRWKAVTE